MTLQVLASAEVAPRLTRRALLGGFAVVGAGAMLSACGQGHAIAPTAKPDGKMEGRLNVYSWGDYDDPGNLKAFQKRGVTVQLDSFASNEEMIAKLSTTRGTSGYDVVVPTGSYVPMMSQNKLLAPLDHSLLPHFSNVESTYRDQPWDPDNRYAVCKDWGTTGFVYDTTRIRRDLTSWADFLDAAQHEASGSTSVLDDPFEFAAMYLAANGHDLNTTDKARLDACEKFMVDKLAPHVRSFSSDPTQNIVQADFALLQTYNGDARFAMLEAEDKRWKFVFPTPTANLWMDTWAIAAGCQRPDSAHAFIDFMLRPSVGAKEMAYIGYPTGLHGQRERATEMKLPMRDLIFPAQTVLDRLTPGVLSSAQPHLVRILGRAQAKAGS